MEKINKLIQEYKALLKQNISIMEQLEITKHDVFEANCDITKAKDYLTAIIGRNPEDNYYGKTVDKLYALEETLQELWHNIQRIQDALSYVIRDFVEEEE